MTPTFRYPFEPDPFQARAMAAIDEGHNVLVSAPTGSGKTVVAEHAVAAAIAAQGRCFYTAPIKALSNQKFNDLREQLGEDRVGLLTGDHALNADAAVVVMTTEVLRNMIYAGSHALSDLAWVVLDEVHFLQDAYRGQVWEEVLINAPEGVRFVCLSATISNAAELGEWVESLRGPTVTVVEHHRPVELESLMLIGDKYAERELLVPLLHKGRINREGHHYDAARPERGHRRGATPRRQRSRFRTPRRHAVIERLSDERLLPTIYFIFSRAGCDDAARRVMETSPRLTTPRQRELIREVAERRTAGINEADLDALDHDLWLATLEHGAAAHHAGMIPAFRETIEECFTRGLLRVVFATETLALGINMPARSVVIERLTKFNGDTHEFLTPAQYTQLTGRAGRRGLDDHGTAIVLWSPFVTFEQVATLAASREYVLRSAFRPTYNMSANLVRRYDRDSAHRVLASSFAQFHNDRALVDLRERRDRLARELARDEETAARSGGADLHGVPPKLSKRRRSLRRAEAEIRRRSSGLVREFDNIISVLSATGHLQGWALTDSGERLRRIYHELDLLISVALDDGLFDGLGDRELAAILSCFTYEHRSSEPAAAPRLPTARLRRRYERLQELHADLEALQGEHGVEPSRAPDAGFAASAWRWAGELGLAEALEEDMTGGDFVRNVRQLVDLLHQIGQVAPDPDTGTAARRVGNHLIRGVIVASSELE